MENNTETVAKRARVEPRTQVHATIKYMFQSMIVSTSGRGSDITVLDDKLMFTSGLLLIVSYLLFKYTVQWIQYYNQTDPRMPDSIWRYTCDYKVIGIRDICDLDDKPFVRQRRKRDKIVTIMYFIVVLAFVFSMYFMASLLGLIL